MNQGHKLTSPPGCQNSVLSQSLDILADAPYLNDEYIKLTQSGHTLDYSAFLKWEEIQSLLHDKLLTEDEVRAIWSNNVKDGGTPCVAATFDQFVRMNMQLDDLFVEEEGAAVSASVSQNNGHTFKLNPSTSSAGKTLSSNSAVATVQEAVATSPAPGISAVNTTKATKTAPVLASTVAAPSSSLKGKLVPKVRQSPSATSKLAAAASKTVAAPLDVRPPKFDVWDPTLLYTDLFEPPFIDYLQRHFDEMTSHTMIEKEFAAAAANASFEEAMSQFNTESKVYSSPLKYLSSTTIDTRNRYKLITFRSFVEWRDTREIVQEGNVDSTCIRELWMEALIYRLRTAGDMPFKPKSQQQEMEFLAVGSSVATEPRAAYMIDFDTFVRLNFRLEEVLEDVTTTLEQITDKDIELACRVEFRKMAKKNSKKFKDSGAGGQTKNLVTYAQLLKWEVLSAMLENKEFTEEQFQSLWEAIPKEPLQVDTINRSGKGFAPKANDAAGAAAMRSSHVTSSGAKIDASVGITEVNFMILMCALEDFQGYSSW